MKRLRTIYDPSARLALRHLTPSAKSMMKKLIEELEENPYRGKVLRHEFSGYFSARYQRWRIIYTIDEQHRRLMIHLIEKRATVYDTMRAYPLLQVHEPHPPYSRLASSSTP